MRRCRRTAGCVVSSALSRASATIRLACSARPTIATTKASWHSLADRPTTPSRSLLTSASSRGNDAAEVAIAVADAWQGHGIGHRLMVAGLDWAKTSGIATLTATMFADNAAIHHLLLGLGLRTQSRFVTGGVSEVRIDLGAEHSQPTAA